MIQESSWDSYIRGLIEGAKAEVTLCQYRVLIESVSAHLASRPVRINRNSLV